MKLTVLRAHMYCMIETLQQGQWLPVPPGDHRLDQTVRPRHTAPSTRRLSFLLGRLLCKDLRQGQSNILLRPAEAAQFQGLISTMWDITMKFVEQGWRLCWVLQSSPHELLLLGGPTCAFGSPRPSPARDSATSPPTQPTTPTHHISTETPHPRDRTDALSSLSVGVHGAHTSPISGCLVYR